MRRKSTITANGRYGDVKITVEFDSDCLTRGEVAEKMDDMNSEIMRGLALVSREPISRIRVR